MWPETSSDGGGGDGGGDGPWRVPLDGRRFGCWAGRVVFACRSGLAFARAGVLFAMAGRSQGGVPVAARNPLQLTYM